MIPFLPLPAFLYTPQYRPKTPCQDGWLEATKGASAAVEKLELHLEASATTAAGASAAASPLSGAAARGADGPPTRSWTT